MKNMPKVILTFIALTLCSALAAQELEIIPLQTIAKGTKYDGEGPFALVTESFKNSTEWKRLEKDFKAIENDKLPEKELKMLELYKNNLNEALENRKNYENREKTEYVVKTLAMFDNTIAQLQQEISRLENKANNPQKGSGINPELVIKALERHSIGGSIYYGDLIEMDRNLLAVCRDPQPQSPEARYGVIDTKGNTKIPFRFNYIYKAYENKGIFVWGDLKIHKRGLMSYCGRELMPCEYNKIEFDDRDILPFGIIKKGNLYGAADTDGNIVLPIQYKDINHYIYTIDDNTIPFWEVTNTNNQIAVYDKTMTQAIPFKYAYSRIESPYWIGFATKSSTVGEYYDMRTWQKVAKH